MTKKKKVVIITAACLVAVLIIAAMICLIPRKGKVSNEVWAAGDEFTAKNMDNMFRMDKTEGKDFNILVLADIQLWALVWDNKTTWDIVDELVETEKPDLIILPGDLVSGLNTDTLTLSVIRHMEKYKIPWAPVFGNHETDGNATIEWEGDQYEKAEYCLFRKGPRNLYGCGNYFINIWENDEIIYSLGMLDNGRYYKYEENKRDPWRLTAEIYMSYEQIAWYQWNVDGMKDLYGKKENIPNMAVCHFAPPEFRDAIEKYATKGKDGRYYVTESEMREDTKTHRLDQEGKGFGVCGCLPSVAPVNSGFIDMAKNHGLTHMLVGHDHENNACMNYEDVVYMYGMKAGPSPAPWNLAHEYGGTIVTIGDDQDVTIRHHKVMDGKYY